MLTDFSNIGNIAAPKKLLSIFLPAIVWIGLQFGKLSQKK